MELIKSPSLEALDTWYIFTHNGTVKLPPAKLKLVLAWLEIHKEDLMADWSLAVEGQQVFQIDPLR